MSEDPVIGASEHRVLVAVGPETASPAEVATRLGSSLSSVHDVLVDLVEDGLVGADEGRVWLTEAGQRALAARAARPAGAEDTVGPEDLIEDVVDAARSLGSAWVERAERTSAERRSAADSVLASDEERDRAVHRLAAAYSEGRLSSAELDDRTGRALAARTHGELDAVLVGLGGLREPGRRRPAVTVMFWVGTVVVSPFLLLGVLLTLFGSDLGDRVMGLVLLTFAGLPLLGLWRWSRPRH